MNNNDVIRFKAKINEIFFICIYFIGFIVQMRIQISLPVVAFNLFLSVFYYSLEHSF